MKYEFKYIKDVDLSKLEDSKSYFIETTTGGSCFSGLVIKNYWHVRDITKIMFPCSPIVETDKLREEFKSEFTYKIQNLGFRNGITPCQVFDFFLPHLSGSKEVENTDTDFCMAMSETSLEKVWSKDVEVSDEEIEKEAKMRCTTNAGYLWALNAKWFKKGEKWAINKRKKQ